MSSHQSKNDGKQKESAEERYFPVSLIESLCICPICYTSYNESTKAPRQLYCGHTFCTQCIENVQKYGNSAHLECPTCRAETKSAVLQLAPNYLAMEIIQKVELMGAEETAVVAPEAPSESSKKRLNDRSPETIEEMVDEAYKELVASVKSDLMFKFEDLRENLLGLSVRVAERELEQLKDEVEKAVRDAYSGFSEEEDDDSSVASTCSASTVDCDETTVETMRNGSNVWNSSVLSRGIRAVVRPIRVFLRKLFRKDSEMIVENSTDSSDISFECSDEEYEESSESSESESSYTSGHSD